MTALAAARARLRALAAAITAGAERGRARYALAWLIVLAVLAAGAAVRVRGGGVTSDLLQLLPAMREDPLLAHAIDRNRSAFLQRLAVAVEGSDAERVNAAALAARRRLEGAGFRVESPDAAGTQLVEFYRRHRFALLSHAETRALVAHPEQTFVAHLAAGLAMPASPAGTPADPGGFLTRYLSSLPRPFPALVPENGMLAATASPEPAYLIPITLESQAFGAAGERRAREAVRIAQSTVARLCGGCRVYASGPALYSAAERSETRTEVSWLSTASTILIVLLVLGVFRRIRPLLLTIVCVGAGIVAGAAATLILFREINLLTLVFGTTLLGIAVDYAFHYLTDGLLAGGRGTLHRVAPGLTLGLVTSLIAFAFLAATPFPALRQVAAFSMAGLASAFLTVFAVFPYATRFGGGARAAPRSITRLAALSAATGRRWRGPITLLFAAAAVGGLFRLHAADDLRELQAAPARLVHQTAAVDALLGTPPARGFLLVRGADLGQALARGRALDARAAAQTPATVLVDLAGFVPAAAAQQQSLAAWHTLLGDDGTRLEQAVHAAGLPQALVKPLAAAWRSAPRKVFGAQELLEAAPALQDFVVRAGGETGLVVQVYGGDTPSALQALAQTVPGVEYVDPLARLNATFSAIRWHATVWVAVGYLVILFLLLVRYGVLGGIAAMIPPVAAALVTLGVLGWAGQPVNVFVVVALMLVAGIGVDYAVFLREGAGGHHAATALAVALAAVTTLASFGLLGASRIPSIHAFGLTVAIGIMVSWLAAPLALAGLRKSP